MNIFDVINQCHKGNCLLGKKQQECIYYEMCSEACAKYWICNFRKIDFSDGPEYFKNIQDVINLWDPKIFFQFYFNFNLYKKFNNNLFSQFLQKYLLKNLPYPFSFKLGFNNLEFDKWLEIRFKIFKENGLYILKPQWK